MPNTLNDVMLEDFLKSTELDICDFKKEIYDITNPDTKIKFLKDIICMANTVRNSSAFIIIGVSENKVTGKKDLFDVDMSVDENTFLTFLESSIFPEMPPLSYYQYKYMKKTLGIFEIGIPTNGSICMSTKDHADKLSKDVVYYRNSSKNSEATEDKASEILDWLKNVTSNKWKTLLKHCEYFQTDVYNYILCYDNINLSNNQASLLTSVPWAAIVDMSDYSEVSGLYHSIHSEMQKLRHVHLITPSIQHAPQFVEDRSMAWIMAGGEDGAQKLTARKWNQKYFRYLHTQVNHVINNFTKCYIIVTLSQNDDLNKYLDFFISGIDNGLMYKYIALSNRDKEIEDENIVELKLTLTDIFLALSNLTRTKRYLDEIYMPSKSGDLKRIDNTSYLMEEFTLIHDHIGEDENLVNHDKHSYYRGEILSWCDLEPTKVICRKEERDLKKNIEKKFQSLRMKSEMIVVPYIAGAGGTSILKSIAWKLHDSYPVVILEKYSSSSSDKLRLLYENLDNHTIIVFVDNLSKEVYSLLRECDVARVKILLVIFERHNTTPAKARFCIEETLGADHIHFLRKFHGEVVDELEIPDSQKVTRKQLLTELSISSPDIHTPFMYCLTTFEQDFVKLSDYIIRKLNIRSMTNVQEDIFCFIAIAYIYAAQEIPVALLNKVSNSKNYLTSLSKGQKSLLTKSTQNIRPLHQSIAKEILINICLKGDTQKSAWRNRLKDIYIQFVDILVNIDLLENELVKMLIYNVFLSRNSGSDFANSISDLPSNDNKDVIFKYLIKNFPSNAHIHGHYSRFLMDIKDLENSVKEINEAISIESHYTFYHTKGLILAKILIDKMKKVACLHKKFSAEDLDIIDQDVAEIISCYDDSIKSAPDNKYAYQSKVHLYLDLVRKMYFFLDTDLSKCGNTLASWCLTQIDNAETSLGEAVLHAEQYGHIIDKENLEGQVYSLKGNYAVAVNKWDNLLSISSIYHPPIRRQIVYTYKNAWSSISPKQKERALTLLEDNIIEESSNVSNILLWLDCARKISKRYDLLEKAIEFLQYATDKDSITKDFYCFVLMVIRSIKTGSPIDIRRYNTLRENSLNATRAMVTRGQIKEFYDSRGVGLESLVSYKTLKKNNPDAEFNELFKDLGRIKGRITQIQRQENGYIEIENLNIKIHFNPSYVRGYSFNKGDENKLVDFVLGFSYDDVYAFDVKLP